MLAESEALVEVNRLIDLVNLNVDDVKNLRTSVDDMNSRIDGVLHLLTEMVKMEDQIKKMEENIASRLSRMEASQLYAGKLVDSLIEMALVIKGEGQQAVIHRAQSRLDTGVHNPETWGHDIEDTEQWPPPGCDAMESIG